MEKILCYGWAILAIVWAALWLIDFIANGNNNHGTLACCLSSIALANIMEMKYA